MVYYIDKSCIDAMGTGNEDYIACFESLALSRRHCENILIAERRVLDALAKWESLSDVSRGIYRKLSNKASEFKLILQTVKRYCRIMGDGDTRISESDDGQAVIYISAGEMGKRDLHKLSIILAENTDDICLYKIIGKYYTAKFNIGRMNIEFEDRLGGGDTTADILERIIADEKNMCLCMVDSDKKYREDSGGETLKKVEKVAEANKQRKFFWEVISLKVHEIENLIPVSVMEEIQREKGFDNEGIEFVKFLFQKGDQDNFPYFYYDFKNGIPMKKFVIHQTADEREQKKFERLEPYRKYWRSYVEEYGIKVEDKQSDVLVRGVCEKILKHTVEYLGRLKNEELLVKCRTGGAVEEYWDSIGSQILSWGCVGERFAV